MHVKRLLAIALTLGSTVSGLACGGGSQGGDSASGGSSTGGSPEGTSSGGGSSSGGTSGAASSSGGTSTGGGFDLYSDAGLIILDGGAFATVPLNGCPELGYNAPVTFGGSQTFQLTVDTGSTDTAVALTSCGTGCDVSPEYSPASGVCGTQTTESAYGTGEWNAYVCDTTVQVGPELPAVSIDFAGITSQQQFFEPIDCGDLVTGAVSGSPIQGILGMGPLDIDTIGSEAQDAYFNELVSSGVTDTMAILLCSNGGAMWFGGYDSQYAAPGGTVQYTPSTMQSTGYWSVNLTGIGLGDTTLDTATDSSIVDTGTGSFLMDYGAVVDLENAISANPAWTSIFGATSQSNPANFFDNPGSISCIPTTGDQTPAEIDAALPPMTLTFPDTSGGGSFTLSMPATQSYLVPVTADGQTIYCAGTGDNNGEQGMTIIGAPMLRTYVTVFDEGGNQIGFVPQNACP